VRAPDIATVIALAGRGSMLHRMAIAWFAVNQSTDLWLGVLADDAAGVLATGTIAFTAAATGSGTMAFYFGAVRVPVGVTALDATTALATNTAAAINANPDLPVTATVTGSTVTFAFRHKGLVGNNYDARINYNPGEVLPSGVALTITQLAGGTSNPSLTNLFAIMSPLWFQIWAHPYIDAVSLAAIETELARRAGPMQAIDGLAITSAPGTLTQLATLGESRNSQFSVIVGQSGANPLTPPMEFAAEVAGLVAFYGAQDPARPFQTLAMRNALPVAQSDVLDTLERNSLLFDGIATTKAVAVGVVQLDRIITTYQTNPSGQPDPSYLDANRPLTLLYLRYSFRVFMSKYARHKLADDGTPIAVGQPIMTPSLGRAEALTWFNDNLELGLVQNPDAFKANLVVTRSPQDRNRLDFLLPPKLMDQLIVVGAQIQFR
jgi:phage tail sheath gpL-like